MKKLFRFIYSLLIGLHFAFAQQSPEEFLGYPIGTSFTRHHKVVEYFEHVAENSTLVKFQKYGETYEGRPLTYAVISTQENLAKPGGDSKKPSSKCRN